MITVDTTAVKDEDKVRITNLTGYTAVYITPSTGIRRELPPHGSMTVTAGELRELSYDNGGANMLHDYIRVCNPSLAAEFGVSQDTVEYNWTEKDIIAALTTEPIEVLLDACDFAPEGVIDNLVQKAVELEIPDVRRREALTERTGRNITHMIENKHQIEADVEEKPAPKKRRASTSTTSTAKKRRTTGTSKAKKTTTAAEETAAEE